MLHRPVMGSRENAVLISALVNYRVLLPHTRVQQPLLCMLSLHCNIDNMWKWRSDLSHAAAVHVNKQHWKQPSTGNTGDRWPTGWSPADSVSYLRASLWTVAVHTQINWTASFKSSPRGIPLFEVVGPYEDLDLFSAASGCQAAALTRRSHSGRRGWRVVLLSKAGAWNVAPNAALHSSYASNRFWKAKSEVSTSVLPLRRRDLKDDSGLFSQVWPSVLAWSLCQSWDLRTQMRQKARADRL